MKLKAVHTYQYVRFQNKNENFLTEKIGMEGLEMTYLGNGVIDVKSDKDHILIFPTNVAYAIPYSKDTADSKLANRGVITDTEAAIFRK